MKRKWIGALLSGLIVILSFPLMAHADQLIWGLKEKSVAAVVWEALKVSYEKDQASGYPQNFVKQVGPESFLVEDEENFLKCNGGRLGSSEMPVYICRISEGELEWKEASSSVQAVLFGALETLTEVENSEGGAISVQRQGGAFMVDGVRHELKCQSDSFGLTPVQSYRCSLSELK